MLRHRLCTDRIIPYTPGKSIEEVQEELGLTDVVKLASNENPLGASPQALAAGAGALGQVHLYPDGASRRLASALATRLNVPQSALVVGNGSDEVIKLLAEAYLEPGDEVVYADPSFSEYAYATRLMGANEVVVPLQNEVHDLFAMQERVTSRTKVVFICNPNNPTGTIVSHDELHDFMDNLPPHVILVCDEAYFEYVDDPDYPDTLEWVRAGRNVVVLRTFSKVYGLAGLRVGYGVAPEHIASRIRRVKEPFNVNLVAQAAALAALGDTEHVARSTQLNRTERERLQRRLEELGVVVTPTQANFLWCDLKRPCDSVFEQLLRQGVIVRTGNPFGRPQHLRVTIGTREQNDRFLAAFRVALGAAEQLARG